jgi:hypothetical protein
MARKDDGTSVRIRTPEQIEDQATRSLRADNGWGVSPIPFHFQVNRSSAAPKKKNAANNLVRACTLITVPDLPQYAHLQ